MMKMIFHLDSMMSRKLRNSSGPINGPKEDTDASYASLYAESDVSSSEKVRVRESTQVSS
jgi:hypothetical protein